jgi:hypothetical protein
MSLADARLLAFPVVREPRGNLTFIEGEEHVPFSISRVYYLYDVPGGAERGGHAHKALKQILIAVSGSFDVHLDDGHLQRTEHLNRAHEGLYVPQMTWRSIDNFFRRLDLPRARVSPFRRSRLLP